MQYLISTKPSLKNYVFVSENDIYDSSDNCGDVKIFSRTSDLEIYLTSKHKGPFRRLKRKYSLDHKNFIPVEDIMKVMAMHDKSENKCCLIDPKAHERDYLKKRLLYCLSGDNSDTSMPWYINFVEKDLLVGEYDKFVNDLTNMEGDGNSWMVELTVRVSKDIVIPLYNELCLPIGKHLSVKSINKGLSPYVKLRGRYESYAIPVASIVRSQIVDKPHYPDTLRAYEVSEWGETLPIHVSSLQLSSYSSLGIAKYVEALKNYIKYEEIRRGVATINGIELIQFNPSYVDLDGDMLKNISDQSGRICLPKDYMELRDVLFQNEE